MPNGAPTPASDACDHAGSRPAAELRRALRARREGRRCVTRALGLAAARAVRARREGLRCMSRALGLAAARAVRARRGGRRCMTLALGLAALAAPRAAAACMTLISGPIVFDVAGCKLIEPEPLFDLHKEKYAWIGGLDVAGRKKFYDSYRGLYLKGKVVKSKATMRGLDTEEAALNGDSAFMFVPPSAMQCNQVLGKRLSGHLKQVCCEGAGEAPCLLDTSYLLQAPKVLAAGAGDVAKVKARRSKDYLAAEAAFHARHWKDAAKAYEKAKANGELDIPGYFHLASAYRSMDQCADAIAPLKYIAEQLAKKQVWADDEADARKGQFLMARCYSKMNDPQNAVLILNSYLLEPAKYHGELADSLKDGDFGWIHTSREYRDYAKEARKKLNQASAATGSK